MTINIRFSSEVHDQLQKLGVSAVYLFGSYADGVAGQDSDVDLGILMSNPSAVSLSTSTHTLHQSLDELFTALRELSGKELDIVFLQRASLELRAHVVRTGKLLYAPKTDAYLDFEEYTIREYADFAPLREEIDTTILQRI